jgi:DNA-binding transcriptional MerR regulator
MVSVGRTPFQDISDEPLLNIKAVSQATGIEPVTLRAWERRYGIPTPRRSGEGYRLYSERDVAILHWLKSKVDTGVTIRQAVAILESQSPQGIDAARSLQVLEGSSLNSMVDFLLDSAYGFDAPGAHRIINQAFALFSVEDVCLKLLLPTLSRIGDEWRAGDSSLQVEHFITNLIRQHLLALDAAMPQPSRPQRVIVGCAPGDWHEMAVLMLSLFLRRLGYQVVYLGQAVGKAHLRETLEQIRPEGVVLSASVFETVRVLPDINRLVQEAGGGRTWFAFGGALFAHAHGLKERVGGIYAGDTLQEATNHVAGLLSGRVVPDTHLGYEPSAEGQQLYHQVEDRILAVTDVIATLVAETDPSLSNGRLAEVAREAASALLAALQFELVSLLDIPPNLAGNSLLVHGVPADRLMRAFQESFDDETMMELAPYLERL